MPKRVFQKDVTATISKTDNDVGTFEGILTKGGVIDSYGDFFEKEAIDNFKTKDGSDIVFLLHQHNKEKELGVMQLWSENGDLKFKAQLDLEKDANGNYLNKDAAKVYSLMKKGGKYDMSVGGRILKGEIGYVETEKGRTQAYLIKEFEVWEGSVVVKGAVPGSKVLTFKNFENKGDNMNEELLKQFNEYKEKVKQQIEALEKSLKDASTSEELKAQLETMKADMEKKLNDYDTAFKQEIEDKMNEFAREFKSIQETEKELTDADLEKEIVDFMKANNSDGVTVKKFSDFLEIQKAANTTSTGVAPAILQQLSRTILRRVQDNKNIWAYVAKMTMSEYSVKFPRETFGSTEVKFIGETDTRTETTFNGLDNVELELHQIYALPVFSNKLIATDVVGFVALVLERVAENFNKKISEKIMYGSGTGEPFGILNDTEVLNNKLEFNTAGIVDYETIVKAKYQLKQDYADKAVIIMNRKSAPNFFLLKDNNARPLFLEAYGEAKQDRLANLPIVYDDTLPVYDEASAGDVVLLIGDMSKYLGATHTNYNIRFADNITQKGFTGYYFETMVGGNVILPEAFVPIVKK